MVRAGVWIKCVYIKIRWTLWNTYLSKLDPGESQVKDKIKIVIRNDVLKMLNRILCKISNDMEHIEIALTDTEPTLIVTVPAKFWKLYVFQVP